MDSDKFSIIKMQRADIQSEERKDLSNLYRNTMTTEQRRNNSEPKDKEQLCMGEVSLKNVQSSDLLQCNTLGSGSDNSYARNDLKHQSSGLNLEEMNKYLCANDMANHSSK